ncbi:MAG TPA: FkbM family methyltransferase [Bryobacteraceae bacterium]|nr:FkbM family methyltransferase [Bryobacteraceae bacterium]
MTIAEFLYTSVLGRKPFRGLTNALIRRIVPAELDVGGATVVLNPNDPVISGALTFGVYERPETRFFCAACRPGMTFLDIGANVGYYTALAIPRIGGTGRVIALEPDPENFQYLQATIRANRAANVIAIPKAVGAAAGATVLHTSSSNRGDNRLYPNDLCDGSCEVEVCTVDDLLGNLGVESVDLIKMDVQGFEGHVLEGMKQTIRRSPNLTAMIEFWPFGLQSAGTSPEGFLTDLEQLNLRLYELTKKGAVAPITDKQSLIRRHPGRQYTNVVLFGGSAEPPAALPK